MASLSSEFELEDVSVLEHGNGVYFGITMTERAFYVLVRYHSALRTETSHGRHAIVSYDRSFTPTGYVALPPYVIAEGHQMVRRDGVFHITNTYYNTLTLVGDDGIIREDFRPNPQYAGMNFNHLNTVFMSQDKMVLGFANRFRSSFQMEFAYPSRDFLGVNATGFGTHNYVETPEFTAVCDSQHGAIIAWPGIRDDQGAELPMYRYTLLPDTNEVDCTCISLRRYGYYLANPVTRFFTRGLAIDKSGTMVSGIEILAARSERGSTPTRIVVIPEFKSGFEGIKLRPVYHLLGDYGDVHDIRIVDRFDFGHPVVGD